MARSWKGFAIDHPDIRLQNSVSQSEFEAENDARRFAIADGRKRPYKVIKIKITEVIE